MKMTSYFNPTDRHAVAEKTERAIEGYMKTHEYAKPQDLLILMDVFSVMQLKNHTNYYPSLLTDPVNFNNIKVQPVETSTELIVIQALNLYDVFIDAKEKLDANQKETAVTCDHSSKFDFNRKAIVMPQKIELPPLPDYVPDTVREVAKNIYRPTGKPHE